MLPLTKATKWDPILKKVLSELQGWPLQVPQYLPVYLAKLAELSVEEGCLLWGGRVVTTTSGPEGSGTP